MQTEREARGKSQGCLDFYTVSPCNMSALRVDCRVISMSYLYAESLV